MAAVELFEVSKDLWQGPRPTRALAGIDLRIEAGEVLAIFGARRSGKTTLLCLLGLLCRPTSGSVVVAGVQTEDLGNRRLADLRSNLLGSWCSQPELEPGLTLLENVIRPLEHGWVEGRAEGERHALRLLARAGLGARARHRPDQLTTAQRRRLAAARAFVAGPVAVFADEPDPATVDLLLELRAAAGAALVIATSDPDLAARAGRVVGLRGGRLEAAPGQAQQLRPQVLADARL